MYAAHLLLEADTIAHVLRAVLLEPKYRDVARGPVQLVEVDVIGLQAPQGSIRSSQNVASRQLGWSLAVVVRH